MGRLEDSSMSPCETACFRSTSTVLAAGIGMDTRRVSSEMLPEKVHDANKRIMLLKSENTRLRMQIQVGSTGSQLLRQAIYCVCTGPRPKTLLGPYGSQAGCRDEPACGGREACRYRWGWAAHFAWQFCSVRGHAPAPVRAGAQYRPTCSYAAQKLLACGARLSVNAGGLEQGGWLWSLLPCPLATPARL